MNQPPPPSSATSEELIGVVLADRYKVLDRIGEGGMGSVYVGQHVTLGKRVALKVLKPELAHDKTTAQRFLREAKATSSIEHDNVVDILDFGETPAGSAFFVMEFLRGQELTDVMQEQGMMPWYRTKPILLQLCHGLAAAHDNGIVHRDMKPGNVILIKKNGRTDFVKLLDFGIAKVETEDALTRAGMVFGTAAYMAPEQATASGVDGRSDMYALACMGFEMLTGRLPFDAKHPIKMLNCHIREPAPSMRTLVPQANVPEAVDQVILRALSKRPDERYTDMYAFAQALDAIPRGEASSAQPPLLDNTVNFNAAQMQSQTPAFAQPQQPQAPRPMQPQRAQRAQAPRPGQRGRQQQQQQQPQAQRQQQPPQQHPQHPPQQHPQHPPQQHQQQPRHQQPPQQHQQQPPQQHQQQPPQQHPARAMQQRSIQPQQRRSAAHAGELGSERTEPRKIVHARKSAQAPVASPPRRDTDPRPGGPPRPQARRAPATATASMTSPPPLIPGNNPNYPSELPALAWLFVGLAESADSELTNRHLLEIAKRLWRWAQSSTLDELNTLVRHTLADYRSLPDVATRGVRTREYNMELAKLLPRPRLAEVLTSLYGIASDDGLVRDGELRFIVNCTMQLGLSPDPRLLAIAFLYIMLCAADGHIDERERHVLREQSKQWAPNSSIAERAVVLRWAIAEFKRRSSPAEKMQCAREAADQLASSTDPETLRRIVNDLWKLAGADGHISQQEQAFISEMIQRFRLS